MASPAVQAEDDIDEQVDEQIDDVDEPSTENEAENQEEEQASAETVDEDRASTDDEDLNPEDEQDVDDDGADSDVDTADSGEGTEGMTTEEEPEPSDDIDDVQDGNGEQTAPTDGLVDVPEITDEVDITEPAEEVLEAEDIGTEEKVDELEEIDFATPVVSPSDTDHVFDASKPYGKNSTLASAMQTGLQVENYAITGTLHPLSDQDHWMAEYWGSGYFVGLHIDWTNITSEALTNLEMIKFGLEPSMGSGAVTLTGDAALRPQNDDDKAGDINFKLTDPSKQKFVVYTKVGDRTKKEEYDLSGLVLEKSQDLTGPTITEETEDMFGVSAATYQRAGTVKTEEKSRKNYLQGELIYQGESANNALTTKWGVGYFVGLHFGDASYWESNEDVSVRVGLYESHGTLYQYDGKTVGGYGGKHTDLTAEELETWLNTRNNFVEIMDDPDKNGVFKISDKDSQVFQVITTKKDDEGKYDVVVDTYDLSELKLVGGVSVDAENSIQPKVLWQQADYSAPFTVVAQLDEESSNSLDKNNFTAKVVGKNNTTAVAGVTATVDGTATSFETEDEVTTWTIKGNIISSASAAEINNKRLEIDLDGNGTAWEPIYLALTGKTITKPFSSVSLSDVSGAKAKAGQK